MNIGNVRAALAGALTDALGIQAYDYVPDSIHGTGAYVYPDAFAYHADFDNDTNPDFIVRLLVSSVATRGGQQELDTLISTSGTGSVIAAIEADDTLGGVISSCKVAALRNYGVLTLPDGVRYFSAELVIEVFDSGEDDEVLTTESGSPIFVV